MLLRGIQAIAKTYRDAFTGVPRNVWLLSFILLVNRSGTMVLPFLALYFTQELGFQKSTTGYFLASYGLGGILGAYLGGFFTSKIGSIRVQVISLLGTAVGFVVLYQMKTFWSISICLLLLSVIAEAVRPANSTAITEHSPPEKFRQSLALNRLMMNLGMSIGPTIGGFLAFWNYQLLFYADALTCASAGLLLLFVFDRKSSLRQEQKVEEDKTTKPLQKSETIKTYRGPLSDPVFICYWLLMFLTALVFFQLLSTKPIYLREKFLLKEWQIGLVFAANTVLIVMVEMVLVQSLERFSTLKIIAWGCFLSCIGFGILPFGYGFWFCMVSVTIWTFGEILSMPVSMAFTAERSSPENRGMYMGAYTMCYAVAFMLGPVIGTYIYQINREWVWHACSIVAVVVLVGFYLLDWLSNPNRANKKRSDI